MSAFPPKTLILLLAASAVAAAAEPEPETLQVTATRRAESAFEVPVATTVLDREALQQKPLGTVMEALRGTPGAWVQQTTPGQGVVILRGLKGSEILHVVDGFRLNNAFFRNAPNQYMALVDAESLERIEVARGPLSSLYGSDAMGGVVHLRSWTPQLDGADGLSSVSRWRMRWNSADRSFLGRAEGAVGNEDVVLSGGLTMTDAGERRVGGGERLPFSAWESRAADLKLRLRPRESQELTLSAQYAEQPQTPRHDELVPGFGQQQANAAEFLFEPQRREFLQFHWLNEAAWAGWDSLELQFGRQLIMDGRRTRDTGSFNLDRERNRDLTRGASLQAFKQAGDSHALGWGAEIYEDTIDASRSRRDIRGGPAVARAPRFPDGSTMRQTGLFVSDDWQALPRLDLLSALRWSESRTELPASAGTPGVRVQDSGFSGSLGASWALSPALRLVMNAGQGFRAPNVFDLGTFGDRPGNRFNAPNPDLESETVRSLDGGFKYSDARTDAELIAYRSRYRDKITSVLTGERTPSGRLITQSRNATRLSIHGLEAGVRHRLGEQLQLRAALTWTRGNEELDAEQYPADRIPPLTGSVGLDWQLGTGLDLSAWVDAARSQERYSPRDLADPRIDPDGTPAWNTWNLRIDWRPQPALAASLHVLNIADGRYREYGSGIDAPGFSVQLGLELGF
ncbi:MAG: TonB-dependent receptor plug domain-containing protein [Gammaproteobacteria bacterium]